MEFGQCGIAFDDGARTINYALYALDQRALAQKHVRSVIIIDQRPATFNELTDAGPPLTSASQRLIQHSHIR